MLERSGKEKSEKMYPPSSALPIEASASL